MNSQKFFVLNEQGEKLAGTLSFPEHGVLFPVAIIVPGISGGKPEAELFDELMGDLVENGFLVCRFSFSGLGESEGIYWKSSLSKRLGELRAILDYLETVPRADMSRSGMFGLSFGAMASVLFNPSEARAFVLVGVPAGVFKSMWASIKNYFFPKHPESKIISEEVTIRERIRLFRQPAVWREMLSVHMVEAIRKVQKPVCLIHAELDSKTPLEGAYDLYRAAHEPKKLAIVPGADHMFFKPHERKTVREETIAWFTKYVR